MRNFECKISHSSVHCGVLFWILSFVELFIIQMNIGYKLLGETKFDKEW